MNATRLIQLFVLALSTLVVQAQTSFTYQGRLVENATAPTGAYDLEFRLFSAAAGGVQVGSVLSRDDVSVTGGLFTVTLDFGAGSFPGADRYLAISVRPGASAGAFTALTPRQQVTPTPYAITAANFSGTVSPSQLSGTYSGAVTFNNAGNSFTGNGSGLTGVNAALLNGQPASFYQNAANLNSGILPAARIGAATIDSSKLAPQSVGELQLGDNAVTGSKIQDGAVSNDDISPTANIDPAKIGSGNISFPEFDALDGATGPLQPQIDQRLISSGGTMTGTISFAGTGAGLQFPAVGAATAPMINMFSSGTGNADRMVIAHSPVFSNYGLQYSDATDKFNFLGSGLAAMTVDLGNLRVGIGTTTPANKLSVVGNADFIGNLSIGASSATRAKVEINGAAGAYAFGQRGVLNSGGALSLSNTGTDSNASLWASGNVWASAFLAFSDERIKRIEGRSDAAADLAKLLALEVTDYTYIDTVAKGAGKQKKVIAQQVERVYPQAVRRNTDTVPDIYQPATIEAGWVKLATGLQQGERVRLIGTNEEGVYEVLEVTANGFRTGFAADCGEVFVYGREVTDFRSVDYEAIAMLNVSATQELNRRLVKQAAELKERDARIEALEQTVADLADRVKNLQSPTLSRR